MGRLLEIAATLLSIGAGVYLIGSQTALGNSYLEVIAHGMGAYFIAKGLWMARSLHLQAETAEMTRKLVELDAHAHVAETYTAAPEPDAT